MMKAIPAPISPTGTLSQNTQRQPRRLIRSPPSAGPALRPAESPAAPLRTDGGDDDRDAVGHQQGRSERLQHPRADQEVEARRQPAQPRADHKNQKSEEIEQLAAKDVGQPADNRQHGGDHEQIGDRHPGDRSDRLVETRSELRQHELSDAGVDLSHEGADADSPDDQPWVDGDAGEDVERRRLPPRAEAAASLLARGAGFPRLQVHLCSLGIVGAPMRGTARREWRSSP
jgi:hypothetical protein